MTAAEDDLAFASAEALIAAYVARRLSPVAAAQALLSRIEALNPMLNAFCLVDAEAALADAEASAERWRNGTACGPLDGVPISIKDVVLTRGWPTRRGSRTVADTGPWEEDAPAVARLRESGAVLLGKTTAPEFAMKPVTDSPLTGVTRNPWNPSLTPGGSSGGAAAAVAAGMGPLALGSDGGGSIRIPASFSGIFGLKPSGGGVPMYPPTPLDTLVGFGPLSRTVGDAAAMLSVISRPDLRDWASGSYGPVAYHQLDNAPPASWRIAWSPTLGFAEQVDDEVAELTAEAAHAFTELGATVETVPHLMDNPAPLFERYRGGLLAFAHRHLGEADFAVMDPLVVAEIKASRDANLETHLEAEVARAALGRAMGALHADYDFLLTPTLTRAAFPADLDASASGARHSWAGPCIPFNLTRQPAVSVPCGFTNDGRPVGLQIVGGLHRDFAVLQAARAFERAWPWAARRPSLEPVG